MSNENKGTLGRADVRSSDRAPTHKGKCEIDGVGYWISAWVRTNKQDGSKFFSLEFTRQKNEGQRQDSGRLPPQSPAPDGDLDDEIPF